MQERKVKPVPFGENEKELLEWAENQNRPFATYVKDLIRKDMSGESVNKDNIKNMVKEVLKEMDIRDIPKEKQSTKLSNKSKKAYRNVLDSFK